MTRATLWIVALVAYRWGRFPYGLDHQEQLFKQADAAMYLAKKPGRNTFCLYDQDRQHQCSQHKRERLNLETLPLRSFTRVPQDHPIAGSI